MLNQEFLRRLKKGLQAHVCYRLWSSRESHNWGDVPWCRLRWDDQTGVIAVSRGENDGTWWSTIGWWFEDILLVHKPMLAIAKTYRYVTHNWCIFCSTTGSSLSQFLSRSSGCLRFIHDTCYKVFAKIDKFSRFLHFPYRGCSCPEGISLELSIIRTRGKFWRLLWLNDVAARKKVDTWGSSEVGKGQPRFINPRWLFPAKRRGQRVIFYDLFPLPLSLRNTLTKNIKKKLFESQVCSIEVQEDLVRTQWNHLAPGDLEQEFHLGPAVEMEDTKVGKMLQKPFRSPRISGFYPENSSGDAESQALQPKGSWRSWFHPRVNRQSINPN